MNPSYCICGATDCKICGPAQGYTVVKRPNGRGGWHWINHDDEDDYEDFPEPDEPIERFNSAGNFAD